MILASRREDDAPRVTVDPKFLPFDSCFEVNERGQKWGRRGREIERGDEEDAGEGDGDTGMNTNTWVKT